MILARLAMWSSYYESTFATPAGLLEDGSIAHFEHLVLPAQRIVQYRGECNNLGEMAAESSVFCRRFSAPFAPTLNRGLI